MINLVSYMQVGTLTQKYFLNWSDNCCPYFPRLFQDPDHWDNPTAFRPERFLEKNENGAWQLLKKERFVPYGFGRRVCLGESLAKDTLRIFFATLVKHLRYNWIHLVSTVPYIDSTNRLDQLQQITFRFSDPVNHPAPDPGNFTETSTVIPDAFHVNIELVRHVQNVRKLKFDQLLFF